MKSKHTPGPWDALLNQFPIGTISVNEQATNKRICTITHESVRQLNEAEANAKLIASAPELLEALKDLAKMVKSGADSGDWGNWSAEDVTEYKKAMKAIRRATVRNVQLR